jgi:hypothetical protein
MTANLETTGSNCVQNARYSFIASARCARNFVDATLEAVASLNGHYELPKADGPDKWCLITRGIVRGAMDFGANLEAVGQGIMLAAIRGAKSEPPRNETVKAVAEVGMHETIALGGDFEAMACGLACGASEGGREEGQEEEEVFMTATAEGAYAGANRSGYIVDQRVERAIRKTPSAVAHAASCSADMRD